MKIFKFFTPSTINCGYNWLNPMTISQLQELMVDLSELNSTDGPFEISNDTFEKINMEVRRTVQAFRPSGTNRTETDMANAITLILIQYNVSITYWKDVWRRGGRRNSLRYNLPEEIKTTTALKT